MTKEDFENQGIPDSFIDMEANANYNLNNEKSPRILSGGSFFFFALLTGFCNSGIMSSLI